MILSRCWSFVQYHAVGIGAAALMSLIISLPPVIFHFSPDYRGVDMLQTNTEQHYVSQVQEVYDGHYSLGNPYLADLKETPYLFPPFSPNLIALIGRALTLDAVTAVMVLRFFSSFAIGFFLYLFVHAVTKRRLIALVAPVCIMMAYNLLDPGVWIRLLHGYVDFPRVGFNGYGRPVNPSVSFLLFVIYMFCFWRFVEEKKRLRYGVVAGLMLGISFYAYLFTWTFVFSLNGVLCLVYAWQKDWDKVKRVMAISGGAAIMGIPYVLHLREIMTHPWYAESAPRFGFVPSREPNISRVVLTALALFAVSFKLFTPQLRRFWLAFFITAIVVVNEHLITGKYIFNHHFHWYYNTPLVIFFLVQWVVLLTEKMARSRRVLVSLVAACMLFVAFANGVTRQYRAYVVSLPQVRDEQRYAPVFQWLNKETAKDASVLGNYTVYNLINSMTHSNAYASPSAMVTLAPNIRFIDNYVMYTYLEGVPSSTIRQYFEDRRNEISNSVFDYQYHFTPGKCLGCFPNEVITYMVDTYTSLDDQNFLAYIKTYPVDYFVWDTKKDPQWRVDRFGWPVAATIGEFIVYDLRSSSR